MTAKELAEKLEKHTLYNSLDGKAFMALAWENADEIISALRSQDRLREALEPFARAEHIVATVEQDGRIRCTLSYPMDAAETFTLASLDNARKALKETQP